MGGEPACIAKRPAGAFASDGLGQGRGGGNRRHRVYTLAELMGGVSPMRLLRTENSPALDPTVDDFSTEPGLSGRYRQR